MKKISLILSFILIILTLSAFFGCGTKSHSFTFTAFGSPLYVEVHGKTLTNDVTDKIKEELKSLEEEFSVNKKNSALSKINSSLNYTLSDRGVEVFSLAKEYYSFSNGKFNPAVYPLSKLWHFTKDTEVVKEQFSPPKVTEISQVLDSGILDFDKIKLKENLLEKHDINCQFDLGGMLKGYASDRVLEILSAYGYNKGYVSFGSSSMCLMEVEKLAIRHPEKNTEILLELNTKNLKNLSVSTSGDYEKYYEYEGVRYSHIIDSKTGYPYSTGVISVTLLGDDGAFLDAMTTALCNCNFNEESLYDNELTQFANKILARETSASIYAVYSKNGRKFLITNKEQGVDFTLLDNEYNIVKI